MGDIYAIALLCTCTCSEDLISLMECYKTVMIQICDVIVLLRMRMQEKHVEDGALWNEWNLQSEFVVVVDSCKVVFVPHWTALAGKKATVFALQHRVRTEKALRYVYLPDEDKDICFFVWPWWVGCGIIKNQQIRRSQLYIPSNFKLPLNSNRVLFQLRELSPLWIRFH